jgi:hypothetical protein
MHGDMETMPLEGGGAWCGIVVGFQRFSFLLILAGFWTAMAGI